MHYRILAFKNITKHNLFETLVNPGFYIVVSACLLLSFFLAAGFSASVTSSGFNPGAAPLYAVITGALSGAFGSIMVEQAFSAGPFLFILAISFFPFLIYLAVSSLYKSGSEKQTGAFELIVYGPVDAITCFLAALARNIVLSALYLAVLLLYFLIAALIFNLAPGALFFYGLVLLFFTATAVFSYTVLISVIVDNTASAIILFLGGLVAAVLLQAGAYALVPGAVKTPASALCRVFQWISPFYYWTRGMDAAGYGGISLYLLDIFCLVALSGAILLICRLVLRVKGVRA